MLVLILRAVYIVLLARVGLGHPARHISRCDARARHGRQRGISVLCFVASGPGPFRQGRELRVAVHIA